MIDVTTRESVICYVVKRDADTMLPMKQSHVQPGTTIWSDCWRAYNKLTELGYTHETVNHSKEFKSVTGVCTNFIEGHWKCLKQYCRMANVLQSKFLFEYVDEYMWVQKYGRDVCTKFNNLLSQIKEKYPV
jgi:transposase